MPHAARRMRSSSALLTLPILFALGGCAGLETGWPFGRQTDSPGPTVVALEPDPTVWCYRTLGQPDCYATEQPQFASRLLGAFIRTSGELIPANAPAQAAPTPQVIN